MNVLFVCTGNTCRSCMAEAIANSLISNSKESLNIEFSSAGIYAVKGQSASLNAALVMEEMGADVSCHIATPISKELLDEADIVLALTEGHRNAIISHFPNMSEKVFTLKKYIGENGDIEDPFGGDINVYRNCANIIKNSIEKLLTILREG